MGTERDVAVEKCREARDHLAVLREDLLRVEAQLRFIIDEIERGRTVADTFAAAEAAEGRRQLTQSIGTYEHLRHHARLALINLGKSEGMTNADVARSWGVSPVGGSGGRGGEAPGRVGGDRPGVDVVPDRARRLSVARGNAGSQAPDGPHPEGGVHRRPGSSRTIDRSRATSSVDGPMPYSSSRSWRIRWNVRSASTCRPERW